jgi:hypothetical protein
MTAFVNSAHQGHRWKGIAAIRSQGPGYVRGNDAHANRTDKVKVPSPTASQLEGTIAGLERLGYTHLEISCTACGHTGMRSFFLMRARGTIAEDTNFSTLADLTICVKCKQKESAKSIRPVHQTEVRKAPQRGRFAAQPVILTEPENGPSTED